MLDSTDKIQITAWERSIGDSRRVQATTRDPARRILSVASTFPRWKGDGTPGFVLHLAQDLQALGWRVDVLAPHAPGAATDEILDGIAVRRFRYMWPDAQETLFYDGGGLANLRRNPLNALKIPALIACEFHAVRRLLATRRYNLVHSHWVVPQGLVGALAVKPGGPRHVISVHGSDIFGLRGELPTRLKRFAFARASAVTANSSATEAAVRAVSPGLTGLHRIPIGVTGKAPVSGPDPATLRARHRRGDGPLLAFVGRITKEKGVDDLLRAVSLLAATLPDVSAMIIGDGQDRSRMETMANALGVSDRTAFLGWIAAEHVPAYLSAADILVVPSRSEGQGLAAIEAMISGTPVVATRCGGTEDAVRQEETGLLVAIDAPQEIARAVERMVREPGLAERLAGSARDLARASFTRERSARAFSDLFDSLLAGERHHGV